MCSARHLAARGSKIPQVVLRTYVWEFSIASVLADISSALYDPGALPKCQGYPRRSRHEQDNAGSYSKIVSNKFARTTGPVGRVVTSNYSTAVDLRQSSRKSRGQTSGILGLAFPDH